MKILIATLAALAGITFGPAARAGLVAYAIDAEHTRVHFEVRHFGTSTTRGRFGTVNAHIALDRAAGSGELSVTVSTADVDSGVGPLDGMLRGGSFLAADAHPQAYFVASKLVFDAGRLKEARGEFTLRGISKPLTLRALNFTCREDTHRRQEVCGGDFEAEFRRSDYDISFGLPFVSDTVRLVIQVEAVRQGGAPPA